MFRADACVNSNVRDGAFRESRDLHRVSVISNEDAPEGREIYERLQTWFQDSAEHLNIELASVAAGDPLVNWQDYGIPSTPPSLPVCVLAGRHTYADRVFFVDYWEPEPSPENLESLLDSPVRKKIREEVAQRLAVLLYIPSTDTSGKETKRILDQVAAEWCRKEALGVSVVALDRDNPAERLLLSFTGQQRETSDWVAVVFGRGKLMQPLRAENITAANLNEQLQWLLKECTCMRPPNSYGVDIPMVWTPEDEAAVKPLRGDTDSLALAWTAPIPNQAERSFFHSGTFRNMLYAFGVLIVLVVATTILLLRRNQWNVGGQASTETD